ncbi:MAG: tRNA (uridine(34)/cytosine(34)/5-carboxymethylaminomethyluridine(34)-2'-O)-methyltransferase TrmL [Porticoccaceae bacterium]
MLHIVLFEPEIPPNTGNIIRLCANTDCRLHLIEPLGFAMDDKRLRRAGLDYREWQRVDIHPSWAAFVAQQQPQRVFAITTKGETGYADTAFAAGDTLVFGPETRGLGADFLAAITPAHRLRIPMQAGSRSLKLSNAVAVVLYEAWRQLGFAGASPAAAKPS